METIKTLKALYKYTQENPNVEVVYVSQRLYDYIKKLEGEYVSWLKFNVRMSPKHRQDNKLYNDCIGDDGLILKVR